MASNSSAVLPSSGVQSCSFIARTIWSCVTSVPIEEEAIHEVIRREIADSRRIQPMTVGKFMRGIDTGEKSSSEQSASRSGDGNFSRAFLIVILRAVHARIHGIFFHQASSSRGK